MLQFSQRLLPKALFAAALLISVSAQGFEGCPKAQDHSLSSARYQFFTAYQTGLDGYQVVCENRCFGNTNCEKKCQEKKATELLARQFQKLLSKTQVESCQSLSQVCLEECRSEDSTCRESCS